MINWKCGIVQGIGFCAFIVEDELGEDIRVRNITIPKPVQDGHGRAGIEWWTWWPEHMGYAQSPVSVRRGHVFALADASEKASQKAEEAWGMRRLEVPENRIAMPGGNGIR